jgi:phospholipase/carboxylesterase
MSGFPDPVVLERGDGAGPLVVLLHGRGSRESEIIALADSLPTGLSYAAVRAPIAEGDGFAWFANRGIGRPVAESLRATVDWFRAWLDDVAPERPVLLAGFSGGAAFAGGLLLDEPQRFAGAAILCGTLPFDAGVPTTPARLAGVPVFLAHGEQDRVIPRELLDRTWDYLTGASGAPTFALRSSGGHGVTPEVLANLGAWLEERAGFLQRYGSGPRVPERWAEFPDGLPERRGPRPEISDTIPQQQLSDNASPELQEELFRRIAALPGVNSAQSAISVPGARGFMLTPPHAGPPEAFLVPSAGEFAHLHPGFDGSLHVALPVGLAADAIARGWAVAHPLAGIRLTPGMVLVHGPRDESELDVVAAVVGTARAWAAGEALNPAHASRTSPGKRELAPVEGEIK